MDLLILQLIVLTALFLWTLGFSILPVFFFRAAKGHRESESWTRGLSLVSCGAAGVFLGTVLLDLFPDVLEQMDKALKEYKIKTTFPLGEFIIAMGLFLILSLEQVAMHYKDLQRQKRRENYRRSQEAQRQESAALLSNMEGIDGYANHYGSIQGESRVIPKRVLVHLADPEEGTFSPSQGFGILNDPEPDKEIGSPPGHESGSEDEHDQPPESLCRPTFSDDDNDLEPGQGLPEVEIDVPSRLRHDSMNSSDWDTTSMRSGISGRSAHPEDPGAHSSVRALALLAALSLHALLEGLAAGLQNNINTLLQIVAALGLHKAALAFSLGLSLARSKMSTRARGLGIFSFAVTCPIGILIGAILIAAGSGGGGGYKIDMAAAVLQGLAAGSFLYVVFFEVLPHEFHKKSDRLLKLACLVVGFAIVSSMVMWGPSDAGDSNGGGNGTTVKP